MILNKLYNIHASGRNYAECMATYSSNAGVNKIKRLPKSNIFRKYVWNCMCNYKEYTLLLLSQAVDLEVT